MASRARAVPLEQLPVELQIKKIFGKQNYKLAIAISWAENGSRQCDRISKQNTNGSYDVGLFQINTVHLKKGYTMKQLQNCTENIKIAKSIFDKQGWNPWVAFTNGTWKNYK